MGLTSPLPPNISRKKSYLPGCSGSQWNAGELIYDWSATHKRTTNITGRADFWIAANNRFLQIEFKAAVVGRLSPEQKRMRDKSKAAGVSYHIAHSADEAHKLLVYWLEECL
jgi:hypothetical protein